MYINIYNRVTKNATEFITNSITNKFAEPNIEATLTEVAENQAKQIIEDKINPEIVRMRDRIVSFKSYLDDSRASFSKEYNTLATEVAILKERNRLIRLADEAIAEGKREAFEELENISKDLAEDKLSNIAKAEMLRVKGFYVGISRIKGVSITYTASNGTEFVDEEIPTNILIHDLLNHQKWQIRAKITELLKNRKEKGVPEALLEAGRRDPNLEVVKTSLKSFESITGFKSADVFNYEPAEKWWSENKEEIDKKLKEQESIQADVGE